MTKAKRYVKAKMLGDANEYIREYEIDLPDNLPELVMEFGEEMILRICHKWIEESARYFNRNELVCEIKNK